ncbi:hypothetical protein GGR53DRAFT_532211 [Hypoxylon sp. FL1150]|nr:hypothetical protein GGR53DRAFT_532211 [Hypoxylon sp. FL1150]
MASSPATRKFLITGDLLYCLGEQIHDRQSLSSLCLVSKSFNRIFSHFLYRELWFCENNRDWLLQEDNLKMLLANERLKHVKKLSFAVYQGVDTNDYTEYQPDDVIVLFNDGVSELLTKVPTLESFSWLGHPIHNTTLNTVQAECEALTDLTVIYPSNSNLQQGSKLTPDGSKFIQGLIDDRLAPGLPTFKNLKRLHIHNMWGTSLTVWRKSITSILKHSPNLSHLGLSISNSTRRLCMAESGNENSKPDHAAFFLRELCLAHSKAGCKPLALQSLHLGHCMFVLRSNEDRGILRPQFPEEHQDGGCLEVLTDLSRLQDLSLDLLEDVRFGSNEEAWWQTAPGPLPKLEKLSIRSPTTWIARWAEGLVQSGTPLRQLRVDEASPDPGSTMEGVRRSALETSWDYLLRCRPQELFLGRHQNAVAALDHVIAAGDSIQLLALYSALQCDIIMFVASRLPKLEGIWVIEPIERGVGFYYQRLGGFASIQSQKASWQLTVGRVAQVCPTLKWCRIASVTWRIERVGAGIIRLRELDRMENDSPVVPEIFRVSLPYTFNYAHAAKYWVNDRDRDPDEPI